MDSGHTIRPVLANGLRVFHIALWLTIPTVFWLCVSEDAHLWITFGLFLLGFLSIACWINGYSFDILSRTLHGDKSLPPLRMMSAVEGCGLSFLSLKYWLPMIAYLIVITVLASTLPLATRNHSYHALLLIGAPVMLAMYWGYLIGLARFAAFGEHTLLYRRRENMRLALTNIRATLALTGALIALPVFCAVTWIGLSDLLISWRELDFMIEAALGSLGFYVVLLCWTIACSHLIARYAIEIEIWSSFRQSD